MGISFSSQGNFEKATAWLTETSSMKSYVPILKECGQYGLDLLRKATPKDTGLTADGWKFKINQNEQFLELYFYNTAHPELQVNLAMLIQLGHGTGSGGYVPPNNYIPPAVYPVFERIGKEVNRRLKL